MFPVSTNPEDNYVPGKVMVYFQDNLTNPQALAYLQEQTYIKSYKPISVLAFELSVPAGNEAQAIEWLQVSPFIKSAERKHKLHLMV
jgi:hypothetical protein